MSSNGAVAVVIPARDESDRIEATVKAAAVLPGVDLVLVVDDGSRDGTKIMAAGAGAAVIRHARPRGKGTAVETGDAAGGAGPLPEPVRSGEADMTIAVFSGSVKLGGHGFVVGLAGAGIQRAT